LHGITFEEAESVVGNGLSREEPDFGHSDAEERVKVVGWSSIGRLIVVIVSDAGPRPRIISARRATKRERDAYTSR
jgi:uncharacterized DUF497 family protein